MPSFPDSRVPVLSRFAAPTTASLYKYGSCQRLDWLRRILLEHQLYFSSPEQFADGTDALVEIKCSDLTAAKRFISEMSFAEKYRGLPKRVFPQQQQGVRSFVQGLHRRQIVELISPDLRARRKLHRIYCLTHRLDNDRLWQEYAGGHTGYCLEFSRTDMFALGRLVEYGPKEPVDVSRPDDARSSFIFQKDPALAWEEEVRLILWPRGQPHEVPFDRTLLTRIYLGKHMSASDRAHIAGWCAERDPPLPIVTL